MSGRCKACDSVLSDNEVMWSKEHRKHEDLCLRCRSLLYEYQYDTGEQEEMERLIDSYLIELINNNEW